MGMCVNDNITALYNAQQTARPVTTQSQRVATESVSQTADKKPAEKSEKLKKIGVGIFSALGVAASLAILSKFDKSHKYSLKPSKMFGGKLKDSYLANATYKTKEIVSMGAGSILGGLLGGYLFDDKSNMNAKKREAVVQMINVSFPIAFVEGLSTLGAKFANKTMPNLLKSNNIFKKLVGNLPACAGAAIGLATGIVLGNKVSNKLNEKIFHKKDNRPIEITDMSAHVDDMCMAATLVAPNNILTKTVSRIIPVALSIPGYETGTKKETLPEQKAQ